MTIITALTVDFVNSPICKPTNVAAKRGRRLGYRQTEDHPGLGRGVTKQRLAEHGGEELATDAGDDKHRSDAKRARVNEHGWIHDGADRDEKHRDQQRRPEELDAFHEVALVGHHPVEGEPAEERSDDAFDADDLGNHGGRQQGGEHERIAQRPRLADAAEEPRGDRRQRPEREPDEDEQAEHDLHDELDPAGVAGRRPGDECQDDQCQGVGEHRRTDGHRHGPVAGETHVAHHRVGDQRVRREQRAEQDRARPLYPTSNPPIVARISGGGNVNAMKPIAWLR